MVFINDKDLPGLYHEINRPGRSELFLKLLYFEWLK